MCLSGASITFTGYPVRNARKKIADFHAGRAYYTLDRANGRTEIFHAKTRRDLLTFRCRSFFLWKNDVPSENRPRASALATKVGQKKVISRRIKRRNASNYIIHFRLVPLLEQLWCSMHISFSNFRDLLDRDRRGTTKFESVR